MTLEHRVSLESIRSKDTGELKMVEFALAEKRERWGRVFNSKKILAIARAPPES
jgi:hypothetical protein